MIQSTQTEQTGELLNSAYRSVKSLGSLILNLMPKVKNEKLKSDMTVQLSALEAFASRAVKLLAEENARPEDEGMLARMTAKWSAAVNTVMDSSSSHLAKLLITSADEEAAELTRCLREAENSNASEASLRLLRDACAFEDKITKDLKVYL